MNSIKEIQERYFSWDPSEDPEFAPFIIGDGTIGGKGRSLLFAIRSLRDSNEPLLRSVVLPRSRYIGTDVFKEFLQRVPDLESLRKTATPEELEAEFQKISLPEFVTKSLAGFLAENEGSHRHTEQLHARGFPQIFVRGQISLPFSHELRRLAGFAGTSRRKGDQKGLRQGIFSGGRELQAKILYG